MTQQPDEAHQRAVQQLEQAYEEMGLSVYYAEFAQ